MPFLPNKTLTKKKNVNKESEKFLNSARWHKTRLFQLAQNPICEVHALIGEYIDCTRGGHIDHIIPRSRGGSHLDFQNLMTLCPNCHDMKTGLEMSTQLIKPSLLSQYGEYFPTIRGKAELIAKLAGEAKTYIKR